MCVDSSLHPTDPLRLAACDGESASQQFTYTQVQNQWNDTTGMISQWDVDHSNHTSERCFDVFNFQGPDVMLGKCKSPGPSASNQEWRYDTKPEGGAKTLLSRTKKATGDECLAAQTAPRGGTVYTVDSGGVEWCLVKGDVAEGGLYFLPCSGIGQSGSHGKGSGRSWRVRDGKIPGRHVPGAVCISDAAGGISAKSGVDKGSTQGSAFGASGPVPHARYLRGDHSPGCLGANLSWVWPARSTSSGGTIRLASTDKADFPVMYVDDNNVGTVGAVAADELCLTLSHAGELEVWMVPLSHSAIGVALFNRSPAAAAIIVHWEDIGLASSIQMTVHDVWRKQDSSPVFGSYTDERVPGHGVTLLLMTPA